MFSFQAHASSRGEHDPRHGSSQEVNSTLLSPFSRVLAWLKAFAKERSLEWRQDETGNCAICRPGSAGGEGAAPVVIQGHVDMVGRVLGRRCVNRIMAWSLMALVTHGLVTHGLVTHGLVTHGPGVNSLII